jgi:hypothetical protein
MVTAPPEVTETTWSSAPFASSEATGNLRVATPMSVKVLSIVKTPIHRPRISNVSPEAASLMASCRDAPVDGA